MERDELQTRILAEYSGEHEALGAAGTLAMLERGRRWNLAKTLRQGGIIVFPHAGVADCGHHVAAAVHEPDAAGLAYARQRIEEGMELLAQGDYWGYNQHCVSTRSDARDAGQVFRYLRGPMNGQILDLTYTDSTGLYDSPPPTWVAGALVEWRLA